MQSQWAAELAATAPPGPILELCAGVGHIGLAAAALSGRELVQVEQDAAAARYANRNAQLAGHGDRISIRVAPMQLAVRPNERFPIIVADPPYLPTNEVPAWPEDPVSAIDGGADGLDLVRVCLRVAARHLDAGGHLLLQLGGAAQVAAVDAELPSSLRAAGVREVDPRRAVLHLVATEAA
jgi:methylase of polypeptide subunit release factors